MIGCGSGATNSSDSIGAESSSGVGGSMARFAISGDFLYTVNNRALQTFDISVPYEPLVYTRTFDVPFDVETLFSYKEYLYVGSETGVHIYTKPTSTTDLEKVGLFTHVRSCDPVVVQDDVAYVTLNTGNSCRLNSGDNALQVLDVKDPTNPLLIHTQREYMLSPTGLGIDGSHLFVCDGSEGLKVFDVNQSENNESNATQVQLTFNRASSVASINCYDVIPYNNLLIVSNGQDIRQFDYSVFPMVEHQ